MPSAARSSASRNVRRNGFARSAKVGNRNPEVVEDDPVEPLGQLAQRGIATCLDGGEDLAHRRHGSVSRYRRARQPGAEVAGEAAEIEHGEHEQRSGYRPSLDGPGGDFGETARVTPDMNADRAELSALTTAVEELTKRVTSITERYSSGVRDDVLAALEEAERALVQARAGSTIALRALAS